MHPSEPDRSRANFDSLTATERRAAIYRLVDEGHGDYTVANAAGVSVEYVRALVAERAARE